MELRSLKVWLDENIEEMLTVFQRDASMTREGADAAVHALVDILDAVQRIYDRQLPALLANSAGAKDTLWDIREEFRHVDYHLHDGGLLEL